MSIARTLRYRTRVPSVPSVAGLRDWINVRGWLHREPKLVVPRTILIVDSNANNRRSTAQLVETVGYSPQQTSSLAAALAQFDEHEPDFVLLGFDLDDATGLEALSKLRELAPGVAVIMLAADLWVARVAEALRQGAVAYMAKPFGANDLREVLARH